MGTLIYPHSGHGLVQAGSLIKLHYGHCGPVGYKSGYWYLIYYAQICIMFLSSYYVEMQK